MIASSVALSPSPRYKMSSAQPSRSPFATPLSLQICRLSATSSSLRVLALKRRSCPRPKRRPRELPCHWNNSSPAGTLRASCCVSDLSSSAGLQSKLPHRPSCGSLYTFFIVTMASTDLPLIRSTKMRMNSCFPEASKNLKNQRGYFGGEEPKATTSFNLFSTYVKELCTRPSVELYESGCSPEFSGKIAVPSHLTCTFPSPASSISTTSVWPPMSDPCTAIPFDDALGLLCLLYPNLPVTSRPCFCTT
mmetsp:Transcript_99409/g.303952  ORF Transcript_99409/g.303952 Transcript_99409/m.303952 type:complete len:249 (-) Transcript_99409:825-1571(-)